MKSGPFLPSISLTLLSSIESSSDGPVFEVTTTEDATTMSTETHNSAVLTIATICRRIRIRAYIDSNGRIHRIEVVSSWGPLTVSLRYCFGCHLQLFVEVVNNEDGSVRVVLEEIRASVGALSIIYHFQATTHTGTSFQLLNPNYSLTLDKA